VASLSPERRTLRARIAATKRHHPDRPDLVADDEHALRVERAADYLRDLIESAPPLRPEDVERLRSLLPAVPAEQDGGAAA
jgi:hypothetical protein